MPIAGAIAVVIVGAILTFAVNVGPTAGFDLRIIGIILMLGGAAGLVLPLLMRSGSRWSGSTVRSRQDVIDEGPPPADPPTPQSSVQ
jgi:hypothetical protein